MSRSVYWFFYYITKLLRWQIFNKEETKRLIFAPILTYCKIDQILIICFLYLLNVNSHISNICISLCSTVVLCNSICQNNIYIIRIIYGKENTNWNVNDRGSSKCILFELRFNGNWSYILNFVYRTDFFQYLSPLGHVSCC